ncbi:hypothetical protein [Demequina sp. NBRC 110053]|uniref:hypothetical protein n=1 Tax=Demequina sp. NBRC 110053 TaxID=1570342 RepID=UPI000A0331F9|nr:hypothetical protein [Demequina sp. NBRC 110053]
MSDLDRLLARSAPPSAPEGRALVAALGALVDETRAAASPRRRRLRSPWAVAGLVVGATALVGGAAYGAVTLTDASDAWMDLTAQAETTATRFEWQTTLPDGTRCVERLTGLELTAEQTAIVEAALADPQQLLDLDAGAVRDDFLSHYDASEAQQEIADRETWESWIDAGYGAVAAIDVKAGRGDLTEDMLDVIPGSAQNEVFLQSSMRVVLDGITAQGVDAMAHLTPETACEAGE